ncbi:hypothetical protein EPH95_14920 [Salicibibacter halophilus]|uniref:Uncharacterized protein n=1 Tax=Salicibibacter halophilus TaxID=2502791 RepID=A0A514LKE0_9BACI|nr:hypothetical protein [Salicibibacter halophilus]QDI92324.1 hypothetical protein EPH95_14920 [Salicibibacter halophilus]
MNENPEQTSVYEYLESLEEYGQFEDNNEIPEPETYVPDPLIWETTNEQMWFSGDTIYQEIFETTFSGLIIG